MPSLSWDTFLRMAGVWLVVIRTSQCACAIGAAIGVAAASEKERAPQTTAGRLAEGARSATEWAQHQEIQTERASSSGGVIAVPTLTPWHDLPGGTISKKL